MSAPTKIYFPQVITKDWINWIEVVNVGRSQGMVTATVSDQSGNTIWSTEKLLIPFQCWIVPTDSLTNNHSDVSLQIYSDQPVLGEKYCHSGTLFLHSFGAAHELGSAGTRLFYHDLPYCNAYFTRILNIGEIESTVNMVIRDQHSGRIIAQFSETIKPHGFWTLNKEQINNLSGTVEIIGTQPIIGERHLNYQTWKSVISQHGQVIVDNLECPKKIHFVQTVPGEWSDWVIVTNVGLEQTKVVATARNYEGRIIWSDEKILFPFQCWLPSVDEIEKNIFVSLEINSTQPVIGERICSGSRICSLHGAAPELGSVGKRLFFLGTYTEASNWLNVLNLGNTKALITIILRDENSAEIKNQLSNNNVSPMGFWVVPSYLIKDAKGTIELISTQPIIGERHIDYHSIQATLNQLGQTIDI